MSNLMVRELIDGLKHLEPSLPGAASRNPRVSFGNVLNFLSDHSALSVEQLASMLAAAKPKPKPTRPASQPDEQVVAYWVRRLKSSEFDLSTFKEVHDDLKLAAENNASHPKKVRMVDLQQIGREYAGRQTKYGSKSLAVSDIRKHFENRLRMHQRDKVA